MQFFFLTDQFYSDYAGCREIAQKRLRPYAQAWVELNGVIFAVPFRSHIRHENVLWTDKANECGLDLSKAVVVTKHEYIDKEPPYIRPNEFDALRGKEHVLEMKLRSYIAKYKKAKLRLDVPRNQMLCFFSTLQYFEEYLP